MENEALAIIGNLYVMNTQLSKRFTDLQKQVSEQQQYIATQQTNINQLNLNAQAHKQVLDAISTKHPDIAEMLEAGFTIEAKQVDG